jgi:hypothetical protein
MSGKRHGLARRVVTPHSLSRIERQGTEKKGKFNMLKKIHEIGIDFASIGFKLSIIILLYKGKTDSSCNPLRRASKLGAAAGRRNGTALDSGLKRTPKTDTGI